MGPHNVQLCLLQGLHECSCYNRSDLQMADGAADGMYD